MRFIGSKRRLLGFIEGAVSQCVEPGPLTFGDLFCGSAAVATHFKGKGFTIVANDNLYFCSLMARAALLMNEQPTFLRLFGSGELPLSSADLRQGTPYGLVLRHLNSLPAEPRFIYQEYTPGGTRDAEFERRYFSDDNGMKIDAIRHKISDWASRSLLDSGEEALLIVDLMRAVSRVANIAGTYGCFLKEWDARAFLPLELTASSIAAGPGLPHAVHNRDAFDLVSDGRYDVLYLDPPYTWRHYGAYYHILETIARADRPVVHGKTGLRPWHSTRSPFCDRERAAEALVDLVARVAGPCHVFLSYNSEGLIPQSNIVRILGDWGPVQCWSYPCRRYRSNGNGRVHAVVEECLYHVEVR